jgi:hypothetical protein
MDDNPPKLVFLVFYYKKNPLLSVSGKDAQNTPIIHLDFKTFCDPVKLDNTLG